MVISQKRLNFGMKQNCTIQDRQNAQVGHTSCVVTRRQPVRSRIHSLWLLIAMPILCIDKAVFFGPFPSRSIFRAEL
jgi:hypothetical protein